MDSEQENGADAARNTAIATAGAQLRAAREGLGVELPHIAAETRIPLRHLEAIEEGNFEALPSRAYAIGFSRTYASAVGLDPAAITDVVRGELADGTMRRKQPAQGMEPGDPARLPSAGLAWTGAFAALVFAVGAIAFYNSYYGAGSEPGSLLATAPVSDAPAAATPNAAPVTPIASGPVVLTATENGIWLRLYEEGGERLFERTLAQGETVIVPATAADPRINTGRPDALAITVGGKPVPQLSDDPVTLSGVRVSAQALLARAAPVAASATQASTQTASAVSRPAVRRRSATSGTSATAASQAPEPAPVATSETVSEPAASSDSGGTRPSQT